MTKLCVSLFGEFRMEASGAEVATPEARRARELFAYLLLYRERLHEREKLATLLWAEQSTARAKQYLRQMLWQVQSSLSGAVSAEPLLLVNQERIGVNPQADLWLDVAELERAFAPVEAIPGHALGAPQVAQLRSVLPLYQGDLLEGCYEDWCIFARERYQNLYLAMLDKLLAYSEAQQEYDAGLAHGRQILQFDRARERTHRNLMRLYYLAGHRTAALQQYEACVAALAEELAVGPAKSTVALYQQICADQLETSSRPQPPAVAVAAALPSGNALDQLDQIQTTIGQLQSQISTLMKMIAVPAEPS